MVASIVEALLRQIPSSEVAGIYFKGSAQKRWDSPVDYVPEVSDVDIHVLLRDDDVCRIRCGPFRSASPSGGRVRRPGRGTSPSST